MQRRSAPVAALAMVGAIALAGGCAGGGGASARAKADLEAGDMVRLPRGTFLLGEPTGPGLGVPTYERVGPFLLDVTEVTVGAYAECARAGACPPAATTVRWAVIARGDREAWGAACNGDRADRVDHPANCVDWNQAAAYCAWAGKRLPSEAEWEWAARNGRLDTTYPWGDEPPGPQLCWSGWGSDGGRALDAGTCPAGSFPGGETRSGLKDLAGNVSEWTSSTTLAGADSRGRGGTTVPIHRGGSWADADPADVTAIRRPAEPRTHRDPRIGFRCASDA